MRTLRFAISVVIGLQLALLVAGFVDAWRAPTHPANAFAFFLVQVLLLAALIGLMERARRNEARRFGWLQLQMEKSARQAEDLIQCSSDLVWEIDKAGIFTFVSDHNNIAFAQSGVVVGGSVEQLAAQDPLTSPESWKRQVDRNRRGEPFRDFRYGLRRQDGTIAHFIVNGVPIHDTDGVLAGFRGLTRDITHEVEALDRLNRSLMSDPLTGLANRRAMRQWLDEAGVAVPNQPVPEESPVRPYWKTLRSITYPNKWFRCRAKNS